MLPVAHLALAILTGVSSGASTNMGNTSVDYDVVYVRAPRFGDATLSHWNDTLDPFTPDAGSKLMLWHHDTGVHELLFPRPWHAVSGLVDHKDLSRGAVAGPNVSYDGKEVVFAYFHEVTGTDPADLSPRGSDIYRLDLTTRRVVRLTKQEFDPNTGNGASFSGNGSGDFGTNPRIGVFNTGPAWLPHPDGLSAGRGGVVFTSTRRNFEGKDANPDVRVAHVFKMDAFGRNVELVTPFSLGRALHPLVLMDGRLVFSSWENQGLRSDTQFPLWEVWPDGTGWMSFSSAFERNIGHHFHTQTSDGDVVTASYYNINNNGFGELLEMPASVAGPAFTGVQGAPSGPRAGIPFDRVQTRQLTPFTTSNDVLAPILSDGSYAGKFTHPSAAPDNDLLVVWTPGPANHRLQVETPTYDGGIYVLPSSEPIEHPDELIEVFPNDPAFNEQWPRAVVPYADIYGIEQPAPFAPLQNDGGAHVSLDADTPFALLGAASVTYRETNPQGGDPFNIPPAGPQSLRWLVQGVDTSLYTDDDIYALRFLALPPQSDTHFTYGFVPKFWSFGGERPRILGEVPLRDKVDPDDTSFLVKLPANTPFTFQALDEKGRTLFSAQTWHSLQPGEMRTCGGCHAHSVPELSFSSTSAGDPGYLATDLTQVTPLLEIDEATGVTGFRTEPQKHVTVEYWNHVRPILQSKCIACHTSVPQAPYSFEDVMELDLDRDFDTVIEGGRFWPGTFFRLTQDERAVYGLPPMSSYGSWFLPQATRYVRAFQSRQSLLAWKVWGERLDGRTNADRPTEAVPGDPTTFPAGANTDEADLDFVGTIMPPPGASAGPLSYEEKLTITRWIDTGTPVHQSAVPNFERGFFTDDLRPVLYASPSTEDAKQAPITEVAIAAYDLESGLASGTLVLSFDVDLAGTPAGTNLAAGLDPAADGRITIALPEPLDAFLARATMTVRIQDLAGHTATIERTFFPDPPVSKGPIGTRGNLTNPTPR